MNNTGTTKVVYVVIGWHAHDREFISAIFADEDVAYTYAIDMQANDEYDYQYKVQAWGVR